MVCVMCLLPLFLVPIVNLLPLLFDYFMARVYALLGWEYRKPERVPPTCPYKPAARNDGSVKAAGEAEPGHTQTVPRPAAEAEGKQD